MNWMNPTIGRSVCNLISTSAIAITSHLRRSVSDRRNSMFFARGIGGEIVEETRDTADV